MTSWEKTTWGYSQVRHMFPPYISGYTHGSAISTPKFKTPDQAKHKGLGTSHLVPAHGEPIIEFSENLQAY